MAEPQLRLIWVRDLWALHVAEAFVVDIPVLKTSELPVIAAKQAF